MCELTDLIGLKEFFMNRKGMNRKGVGKANSVGNNRTAVIGDPGIIDGGFDDVTAIQNLGV